MILNHCFFIDGRAPVVTVQLRYNGWVTELQDLERSRKLRQAIGLDNLFYTPDADFSYFADLALTSPEDYYIEGLGSLLQCVLTPGDPYMPLPNDEIIERVAKQEMMNIQASSRKENLPATRISLHVPPKGPAQKTEPVVTPAESTKLAVESSPTVTPTKFDYATDLFDVLSMDDGPIENGSVAASTDDNNWAGFQSAREAFPLNN
ncbi:hypothetical protein REPUB_Repub08aG0108200 [Reevesia pubescens]